MLISFLWKGNLFTIYLFLFVFSLLTLILFLPSSNMLFLWSQSDKECTKIPGVCLGLWEMYPALKWLTYQGSGTKQPRDRASNNLVYHDLGRVCPKVHLGAQQGIISENGRQEYVQSQYYIRPRPENPLDYRAGHRGMGLWEESDELRLDLELSFIQRSPIGWVVVRSLQVVIIEDRALGDCMVCRVWDYLLAKSEGYEIMV